MRVLRFLVKAVAVVIGIGVVAAVSVTAFRAIGWDVSFKGLPFYSVASAIPVILGLMAIGEVERRGDPDRAVIIGLIAFLASVLAEVLLWVVWKLLNS